IQFLDSFILIMLPYLGLVIGGKHGEWLEPARLVGLFRADGAEHRYKILDTSVIIDGRIADVCESGFLDGTLVIPQFVLKELQLVADSSDSMKRNRGRRGLDILQKIQKMSGMQVTISDADFPDIREVDLKLIELARTLQGKIVTNDFNLNKVAQLRGVAVLNVNELANALKPVVLPGELMKVFILKEGKEYNQGVAYLDDGTMVVVDNARKMISKTIDIVVTSVLQTTAGKMIFGRYIEPGVSAQTSAPSTAASDTREDSASRRARPTPQPQQT
ncbi:MAG TPA: PIN domain-containing protein, partial [Vicinamibacterales bacterium]|nr:PIN domain-containing protein [Vicinamibacterales bacterium]